MLDSLDGGIRKGSPFGRSELIPGNSALQATKIITGEKVLS
jgi:hypothetical protein